MRLYGGRILQQRVQKQIGFAQELRDAVVIDVYPDKRYCRVKIQGSDVHIKAYYPENWEQTPVFLKPGNAVRITTLGGSRSRIEVSGHGIIKPTTTGNQTITPVLVTPPDTILDAASIIAANPPGMAVTVLKGTYRIDGVVYELAGLLMDDSNTVMDRFDLVMDEVGAVVYFDAAHSSLYRYDSIVVDANQVVSVVKGTNFSATTAPIPEPPPAPVGKVRIGWVLISPGLTEITAGNINKLYTPSTGINVYVALTAEQLAWGVNTSTLRVGVVDQYGNFFRNIDPGWEVTVEWLRGTGYLSADGVTVAAQNSLVCYHKSTGYKSITYTRNIEDTEESPQFFISISGIAGLGTARIKLLNSSGEEIP